MLSSSPLGKPGDSAGCRQSNRLSILEDQGHLTSILFTRYILMERCQEPILTQFLRILGPAAKDLGRLGARICSSPLGADWHGSLARLQEQVA